MTKTVAMIARLRITLDHLKPAIWRQVEVPLAMTLADLHLVVQAAMGWTNTHLYEFRIGRMAYGEPDPEDDLGMPMEDAAEMPLARILVPKRRIAYTYDFGDDWGHTIRVEAIASSEPGVRYPRLLEGAQACPPEDIGGPYSYLEFLEAIADPAHERHAELREWWGGSFDPAEFDEAAARADVDRIAKSRSRSRKRGKRP